MDAATLSQMHEGEWSEGEQGDKLHEDFSIEISICKEHEGTTPGVFPVQVQQTQKESEDGQGPLPPDGGWGWVVVLGATTVSTVIPMLSSSFGVLFSPQLLQWRVTSTTVAVLFNAFMVSWRVAGMVMVPLIREFGFRCVAMTGTLLTAVSLTFSAFATSPQYFLVSLSLGCGVGCGLSCCGFLIISHYFKKRRGMANTCLTAGIGLGSFLGPMLIQLLQDSYGYRAATMVLGAVVLHGFVGATLYHPVEWHMKRPPRPHPQQAALIPPTPTASPVHAMSRKLSVNSFDLTSMASGASLDVVVDTDLPQQDHEPPQTQPRHNRQWRTFIRILKSILQDLAILRRPFALIIALGPTLVLNAKANFTMMVPFVMQAAGHSLQTAAWCLSLSGVANLIARMLASALSDFPWFNMRFFYMAAMFTMATSVTVFPFQTEVVGMAGVIAVWGVADGVYLGLMNLHTLAVVGQDDFASVYGARSLTLALGFVTVGPLIGVVRDASGSYAISVWVVAGLIFVSFLLWLFVPTAVTYDQKMKRKQASSV